MKSKRVYFTHVNRICTCDDYKVSMSNSPYVCFPNGHREVVAGRGQQSRGQKAQRRCGPAERERGILVRCGHAPRLPATAAQTPRLLCVFPLTGEESTHTAWVCLEIVRILPSTPSCPDLSGGTVGRARRGSSRLRLVFSAGGLRSLDQLRSECEAPSAPLVSRQPFFPPKGIAAPPGAPRHSPGP